MLLLLLLQIPMVPGVTSNLETRRITLIHKRLVASQTTERLASCECSLALSVLGSPDSDEL